MNVNIGWRDRNECAHDHILEINILLQHFHLKASIKFIRINRLQSIIQNDKLMSAFMNEMCCRILAS